MKLVVVGFYLLCFAMLTPFEAGADSNQKCKIKMIGRASLQRPISGEALQPCHRKVQMKIASQAAAFRYCREKFGNKGEVLALQIDVSADGKISATHDCAKIIEDSKSIEEARAVLNLSVCYAERLEKISLDKYQCDCAIPYKWDGTFPLVNSEQVTFPAAGTAN